MFTNNPAQHIHTPFTIKVSRKEMILAVVGNETSVTKQHVCMWTVLHLCCVWCVCAERSLFCLLTTLLFPCTTVITTSLAWSHIYARHW